MSKGTYHNKSQIQKKTKTKRQTKFTISSKLYTQKIYYFDISCER